MTSSRKDEPVAQERPRTGGSYRRDAATGRLTRLDADGQTGDQEA